ncbi:PorV/PorQ family protein [Caldithrix abyssi]|uniref:PorV/PorQ family protein n=1 Tax=Caldithrix abyssi DSM 13497 TaxID=880073 RepID=H1XX96_CALAY|nr:hypothetical protein [Caldithrix abyssi]APF20666.1 hypothetical protein Cabys_3921 [Caldithrix abyssi DSM 13497]EHO40833.1 hypothetical protein Calab_1207 [Caldithrix abyssi DSM 13497]
MRFRILTTTLLLLFLNAASQAGVFDSRYPSARATAMSEALVSVPGDFWAPYINPASLAGLNNWQVGSSVQRLFNQPFLQNAFFGALMPLPSRFGTLALNFEFFGVRYEGNTLSQENTFTLSHGFFLLNDLHSYLSVGYNLKYYYWDLGRSVEDRNLGAAGAFGFDVGLQASLYHRIFAGVYAYNLNAPTLGNRVKHDLPQRIVVGVGYRPMTNVLTTLSLDKTVGFDTHAAAGIEFWPVRWLALRAGAMSTPNRVSAGIGLKFKGLMLDYSFQNHPVLPETHKIGIIYQIGGANQ